MWKLRSISGSSGLIRPILVSRAQLTTQIMSERALENGEKLPPVNPELMRIYSMRFCPFAQRTRMVLLHKKIPHEIVNVNLRHKPDWFLERNPLGLVPVLEHKGHVVYESRVCDDFLERMYPDAGEGRLTPDGAIQQSQDEMLMSYFDAKVPASIYGIRRPDRAQKARAALAEGLKRMEQNLGNKKFFGGNGPNMVDFHCYPWFERFEANNEIGKMMGDDYDPFPRQEYPHLTEWLVRMQSLPAVRDTMMTKEHHMEFQMSFAKRHPEYDIGLNFASSKI